MVLRLLRRVIDPGRPMGGRDEDAAVRDDRARLVVVGLSAVQRGRERCFPEDVGLLGTAPLQREVALRSQPHPGGATVTRPVGGERERGEKNETR